MIEREPGQDIVVLIDGKLKNIQCNENVFKHLSNGALLACDASRCDIGDMMTAYAHEAVRVS